MSIYNILEKLDFKKILIEKLISNNIFISSL